MSSKTCFSLTFEGPGILQAEGRFICSTEKSSPDLQVSCFVVGIFRHFFHSFFYCGEDQLEPMDTQLKVPSPELPILSVRSAFVGRFHSDPDGLWRTTDGLFFFENVPFRM